MGRKQTTHSPLPPQEAPAGCQASLVDQVFRERPRYVAHTPILTPDKRRHAGVVAANSAGRIPDGVAVAANRRGGRARVCQFALTTVPDSGMIQMCIPQSPAVRQAGSDRKERELWQPAHPSPANTHRTRNTRAQSHSTDRDQGPEWVGSSTCTGLRPHTSD